jgi:hypothetical protein
MRFNSRHMYRPVLVWLILASGFGTPVAGHARTRPPAPDYSTRPVGDWLEDLRNPAPRLHNKAVQAVSHIRPVASETDRADGVAGVGGLEHSTWRQDSETRRLRILSQSFFGPMPPPPAFMLFCSRSLRSSTRKRSRHAPPPLARMGRSTRVRCGLPVTAPAALRSGVPSSPKCSARPFPTKRGSRSGDSWSATHWTS